MKNFEVIIVRFAYSVPPPKFHRYVNADTATDAERITETEIIPQIAKDRGEHGWENFYTIKSVKEVVK